ncbi:hypothetical protein SY83_10905 [Paenibacillus swuensis]|uniref:SLH domain-containing protein n=1 Tax=Paenibacillus swuensis TaxID=1178515 RepID=A0A172TIK8_9BACL|nr:S-layer homology domain-containing protein [Paenibacillus swuensis]ANE46697.1 hypothetical protein SY83_10905 [Paenibacillus swuensis]
MSNTSFLNEDKENNVQHNRGGEKKVMKKIVSVALSTAMAFSMFASVVSGAELTTTEKFEALKAKGILSGVDASGNAGLSNSLTRAELAKILVSLKGLTPVTGASTFKDVKAGVWSTPYINAASKAGLVAGTSATTFAPTAKVTVEQVARVLVVALGIDHPASPDTNASAWAKEYVAAAVKSGLISSTANFKGIALRSVIVDATYTAWMASQGPQVVSGSVKAVDANNIEVTFSDDAKAQAFKLDKALVVGANEVTVTYKGKEYKVTVQYDALAVSSIAQSGAKKITVNFNKAVSETEKAALTYDVKNGLVPYTVTPKFADDNKSVVLTATFLPAGDYTVTVKGFEAKTVKVEEEKVAKVEIGATSIQKTDGQDLKIKALNQFNEEVSTSLNTTVFNATKGNAITANVSGTYDLKSDDVAKVDDSIIITVLHPSTGLSASKTLKVVAGSSATVIQLSTVAPLKDKTRISTNEKGLVLPYKLADQYGQDIKLPLTSAISPNGSGLFSIGGINFVVNDATAVKNFAVDKDGVLTFETGTTATTVVLTAVNNSTGASATTTFKVEGSATVKSLDLSNPGVLAVSGEEIKIPYVAVDTYGAPTDLKTLDLSKVLVPVSNNSQLKFAEGYPKLNAKGELVFKFTGGAGSNTNVYAYIGGVLVDTLTLDVKAAATPVKIHGIKDVATAYAVGASNDFDADNITYVDNYGRVNGVAAGVYSITSSDNGIVSTGGNKLTAVAAGTAKITVALNDVANSKYEFDVTVVKNEDVKTFAVKAVPTLFADKADDAYTGDYSKTVTLVGKTANGTEVAIVQSSFLASLTTSDESIVTVNGTKVWGKKAGTATVTAYNESGAKVADTTVTVSDAAPVASAVTLNETEYKVGLGGTVTATKEVKDQYGVVITPSGTFSSSDTKVATVSQAGVISGKEKGTSTLTYRTSNGTTATATIVVE